MVSEKDTGRRGRAITTLRGNDGPQDWVSGANGILPTKSALRTTGNATLLRARNLACLWFIDALGIIHMEAHLLPQPYTTLKRRFASCPSIFKVYQSSAQLPRILARTCKCGKVRPSLATPLQPGSMDTI